MPIWIGYIIAAAALVTALSVLWKKALKPAINFTVAFVIAEQQMLPLLQQLTKVFQGTPHAFEVLDEIVAEFRSDSGSTLRDVINRIEDAAKVQQIATEKAANVADSLKVGVEAAKLLAGIDRDKLQAVALLIDRLGVRVDAGAATGLRNEQAGQRIELQAAGVADKLAAAQQRATEVESDEAGAAADAAALKPSEDPSH